MTGGDDVGVFIGRLIAAIKTEMIEWEKKHHEDQIKLERDAAIARKQTEEQLKSMDEHFKGDLARIKNAEEHLTRDYAEFLSSIDEMKSEMLARYPTTPKPVILTIHHKATDLLISSWSNDDVYKKEKSHVKLMQLMQTVMVDFEEQKHSAFLSSPRKTLALLNDNEYLSPDK